MVNNKIYFKYRKKKVNKIDAPTTKYRSFFFYQELKNETQMVIIALLCIEMQSRFYFISREKKKKNKNVRR